MAQPKKRVITLFGREVVLQQETQQGDINPRKRSYASTRPNNVVDEVQDEGDEETDEDSPCVEAPQKKIKHSQFWEGDLLIRSDGKWRFVVRLSSYNCKIEMPSILYIDLCEAVELFAIYNEYKDTAFDFEIVPQTERDEMEYLRFFTYLSRKAQFARLIAGPYKLFIMPPRQQELHLFTVDSKVKCYVNLPRYYFKHSALSNPAQRQSESRPVSHLREIASKKESPQRAVENLYRPERPTSPAKIPPWRPPLPLSPPPPSPPPPLSPVLSQNGVGFQPFKIKSPPSSLRPGSLPTIFTDKILPEVTTNISTSICRLQMLPRNTTPSQEKSSTKSTATSPLCSRTHCPNQAAKRCRYHRCGHCCKGCQCHV